MNRKTKLFITSTMLAAACLLIFSVSQIAATPSSAAYLPTALLALFASTLKVRLPGIQGTISVNFLFILIAIALFSFSETVVLASAAALVQCFWRPQSRIKVVRVAFNVAVLAISSGAAFRISHFLTAGVHTAVLTIVAAAFYFLADTLLISGVLSLVGSKSLFTVWGQCYLWSFPYYLTGAALAGFAIETNRAAGSPVAFLILTPMALAYLFFRLCVDPAQASAAR
jgi:hypothetical protein